MQVGPRAEVDYSLRSCLPNYGCYCSGIEQVGSAKAFSVPRMWRRQHIGTCHLVVGNTQALDDIGADEPRSPSN